MEFVYVVKRFDLFERACPHGLVVPEAAEMDALLARIRSCGFFVERRHAEQDASMKQVIPYCVVTRGDEVFLTQRIGGGEGRLHGKRSIGIGGHVNPIDDGQDPGHDCDLLDLALQREIDEEISIDGHWSARVVGSLNDDSTDVGSVHFGLVAVVSVDGDVTVRETDTLTGSFVPRRELLRLATEERDTFETWSALLIDRLDAVLGTSAGRAVA